MVEMKDGAALVRALAGDVGALRCLAQILSDADEYKRQLTRAREVIEAWRPIVHAGLERGCELVPKFLPEAVESGGTE